MNEFLSVLPSDVSDLILDLTIDLRRKEFNFDFLLSLLKFSHNKKVAREEILFLSYLTHILEDKEQIAKCPYFIIDLIKIDEIGLAYEYYSLIKRTNAEIERKNKPCSYSTDSSDDSQYDYRGEIYNDAPFGLNYEVDSILIKNLKNDGYYVEMLFKIGVDHYNIYDLTPYEYEELFLKASIKYESANYCYMFLEAHGKDDLYFKYEDIAKKIANTCPLIRFYLSPGYGSYDY